MSLSFRRSKTTPASHQRQYASHGTPSASVWTASARVAARPAATAAAARSPVSRRGGRDATKSARLHAMKSNTPTSPGLDAELGVVRLAGLQLHAEALRDRAGVAEPVALRVVRSTVRMPSLRLSQWLLIDGSPIEYVPERPRVGRERAFRLRLRLLVGQVALEPVRARRDVVEDRGEGEADGDRADRRGRRATSGGGRRRATSRPTASATIDERENVQSRPAAQSDGEHDRDRPRATNRCQQEQRDHEHVRGRERRDERRDQPAEEPVARVEREVLGQAAGPVVVVAELVVEVADGAGVPPPLDRDGVHLDQPPGRDRGRGARDHPARRGGRRAAASGRGSTRRRRRGRGAGRRRSPSRRRGRRARSAGSARRGRRSPRRRARASRRGSGGTAGGARGPRRRRPRRPRSRARSPSRPGSRRARGRARRPRRGAT